MNFFKKIKTTSVKDRKSRKMKDKLKSKHRTYRKDGKKDRKVSKNQEKTIGMKHSG